MWKGGDVERRLSIIGGWPGQITWTWQTDSNGQRKPSHYSTKLICTSALNIYVHSHLQMHFVIAICQTLPKHAKTRHAVWSSQTPSCGKWRHGISGFFLTSEFHRTWWLPSLLLVRWLLIASFHRKVQPTQQSVAMDCSQYLLVINWD